MNRAERRKQERQYSGMYWRSKEDWERDKECFCREAKKVAAHQINVVWAGFLLAMKRDLHLSDEQIDAAQTRVKEILSGVESATELREQCKAETGVDVLELVYEMDDDVEGISNGV